MHTSRSFNTLLLAGLLLFGGCNSAGDATPATPTAPASPVASAAPDASPTQDETDAPPRANAFGESHKLVYVPTYSHIFTQDESRNIDLAATLSVRNTDPEQSIVISTVTYFDSDGTLLRRYLETELTLPPLASRSFVVAERDRSGGVGANFLVEWNSSEPVSEPLIEAVMITTRSSQGISFVSRGVVVRPVTSDS